MVTSDSQSICQEVNPTEYLLTFHAEWSLGTFPKQYPTHRPPAQWSLLFGCSHSTQNELWAEGQLASPGLRQFAEEGVHKLLEEELTGPDRRCFHTEPLPQGVGNRSVTITVEPGLPLVSLLVRIVPSPDWFVGVNSLNLCNGSRWQNSLTFDLFPWDAGTDSGFVFSSPNFATDPQEPISKIMAQRPSHPANSFYYPRLQTLPRLGFLHLHLVDSDTTNDRAPERERHNTEHTEPEPRGTPLDCEVSDWSRWGLCSRACGKGSRLRTRYILLQPANHGEPCPALEQYQDCEERACPPKQQGATPAPDSQDAVGENSTMVFYVAAPPSNTTVFFNGSLQPTNESSPAKPFSTQDPLDLYTSTPVSTQEDTSSHGQALNTSQLQSTDAPMRVNASPTST
ncbi:SPON2 protein, partial [Amia calva]|nr:SPON2 protein [Amia calva]